MEESQRILLTGGAGFIGSHLAEALLEHGGKVVVLDNFNDFYSPAAKKENVRRILKSKNGQVVQGDIRDKRLIEELFDRRGFSQIIHLAALAGVRSSLLAPELYYEVNVGGTLVLLEAARRHGVEKFVFASSSSVYGDNPHQPLRESEAGLAPLSVYGVTKIVGEQLCRVYHRAYGLRVAALRFFTVYGPRQRPDMAIHKFSRLIWTGKEVPVFGDGTTRRDYTYVSDIVAGVRAALEADLDFDIFNLGGGHTIALKKLIQEIGRLLQKPVRIRQLPFQAGDVRHTWADVRKARKVLGYRPRMGLREGLKSFISWLGTEMKKSS